MYILLVIKEIEKQYSIFHQWVKWFCLKENIQSLWDFGETNIIEHSCLFWNEQYIGKDNMFILSNSVIPPLGIFKLRL